MSTTACLITDPPQFNPPKHTRPFLVEATADPDPRKVLAVDTTLIPSTQSVLTFSADVISQDDPADTVSAGKFQQVEAWLFIDYGLNGPDPTQPYGLAIPHKQLPGPGGTLDQTSGRRVSAQWTPGTQRVDELGCHTATLMVSHNFDNVQCPTCADDFSAITWQILRCNSSTDGCKDLPIHGEGSCEGLTNSCALVHAKMGDAGATCPDETTDGGAQ